MDGKFEVMVAGTILTLKGDETKLRAVAERLNAEVNDILLNDARSTKLEAALICALHNLEAKEELEAKLNAGK